MIKNKIIVVLMFLSSFSYGDNRIDALYSRQELIADKLSKEVADDISIKHNLDFCGIGGSVHKEVEKVGLSFNCYRKLSVEDARELLVSCAELYLQRINGSADIRRYMHVYPFTEKELELRIFICSEEKGQINYSDLVIVSLVCGKIKYKKWKTEDTLETVLEETFEEAERIAREAK
ncbi:MAG: hypothetical protein H7A38_01310 [Chlamydiales bacterium]|nr:hypothetical protein [Chlamydiales bacterium]